MVVGEEGKRGERRGKKSLKAENPVGLEGSVWLSCISLCASFSDCSQIRWIVLAVSRNCQDLVRW